MLQNENKYQKNLRKTIFFFTTIQQHTSVAMLLAILVLVLDSHCQDEYFNYCPSLLWSGGWDPLCGVECHMGLSQQDARVTKSGGLAIIRKYMPSRCDNKILT